jgi:thiol-disulfide isomerase/thioredoxin/sugar lactone lactonase YvrE
MNKFMKHILLFLIVAAAFSGLAMAQDNPYAGNPDLALPPFPDGLEWVNVTEPLTVEGLRGKIVVFDFWTYGCINCIHMIPVLQQLEEKYTDELVVIGVHSAKFANEGETENIRQIAQRYDVHHPIINDRDFAVWRTYGIRAWPTFMIVDPLGNIVALQSGEIPFDAFDQFIGGMVDYWDEELDRTPLEFAPEGDGALPGLLAFPGKVTVADDRLFIADSSHHRIIIADLTTYEVLDVIGTGYRGMDDGDFATATFNTPQGMALRGSTLYIADTNNHAIRAADLDSRTVTTVAGTGSKGSGIINFDAIVDNPLNFDLRSPWDVELGVDDTLYIAMAGTHQIWEMNLEEGWLTPSAGSGREAMLNTSLERSELAQPSGLYYRDGRLYFADSESSTIRVADYNEREVETLSGTTDNSLFDFGDVDGALGDSRLQHALGVTGTPDGILYIADTYNSKIKRIDADNVTTTLFGQDGNGGFSDGGPEQAAFDEPGGLEYARLPDGREVLFVADTNNHVIRIIDLANETVETLVFPNPEALQIQERVTVIGGNQANDNRLVLPEQTLAAGAGSVNLRLTLPDGYKINETAPSLVGLRADGDAVGIESAEIRIENPDVTIPVNLNEGTATLTGTVAVYYCQIENETLCFIEEFELEVPVTVGAAGESEILIEREIVLPDLSGVGSID